MIFDITDPYCTRLLKGIEASLIQTTYLPLIMSMQNHQQRFDRSTKCKSNFKRRWIHHLARRRPAHHAIRAAVVVLRLLPSVGIAGRPHPY
jgi:hypothetical protein